MIQSLKEISPPTRELCRYVAEARDRDLPAGIVEKAKQHILDTVAAMVSGTRLLPGEKAIAFAPLLGGPAEASVIGTPLVISAINAALINGMLAHADETDDSHAPSRTHPGCAVVPAALAAGEKTHASGEQLIRAVVLGYDVSTRVNYALDADALAHASRSTHSFGGCFGAGAAAGALLGVDVIQARHLMSYCAQQASGVACNVRDSDHIEKAFDFAGMPARNGMTAAAMVAAGFTGVDDVFSGERNFLEAFSPGSKPEQLADGLGARYEILGTNIKKWCVGSPAQAALDALQYLIETSHIGPGDIGTIVVHLPTRSARTVDNAPMPNVNVQHLVAMLLIDGALTFDSVHDVERMTDPQILSLRQRILISPSEELMHARPRRQSIVEVTTRDGRHLSHRTIAVRGTADNPMSWNEIEAKARDLLFPILGTGCSEQIVETVRHLEHLRDITAMRAMWNFADASRLGATS